MVAFIRRVVRLAMRLIVLAMRVPVPAVTRMVVRDLAVERRFVAATCYAHSSPQFEQPLLIAPLDHSLPQPLRRQEAPLTAPKAKRPR